MENIDYRTTAEFYIKVNKDDFGGITKKTKDDVMKQLEMLVENYKHDAKIRITQTERSLDSSESPDSSEPDFIVSMIGRQQDIARVSDELHDLQYCTITGPY
jgi:hypothetical protein